MELATAVAMDKAEAAVSAASYRKAFLETAEDPLRRIADGYEALAEGVALVDLPALIREGGLDDQGHPRLAACRADARVCFVRTGFEEEGHRDVVFTADDPNTEARANIVAVSAVEGAPNISRSYRLGALVPLTPPEHRPRGKKGAWRGRLLSLRNYIVLWEVEEGGWAPRSAPRWYARDPALLRHVSGDLYAVLAVWDLTDLERLVLGGRR